MKFFVLLLSLIIRSVEAQDYFSLKADDDTGEDCTLLIVDYAASDLTDFLSHFQDISHNLTSTSRVNFVYSEQGEYMGVFYDYKSPNLEPQGFIIGDPIDKENLADSVMSKTDLISFKFNDPILDLKNQAPLKISLGEEATLPQVLQDTGVTAPHSMADRFFFAKKEGSRKMDYRGYLYGDFILIDGYLYNRADAGNYAWGAGMKLLGFDYPAVKIGSEVNGFFSGKNQNWQGGGITLSGDATKDQHAIKRGFEGKYSKVDPLHRINIERDSKKGMIQLKSWAEIVKNSCDLITKERFLSFYEAKILDDSYFNKLISKLFSCSSYHREKVIGITKALAKEEKSDEFLSVIIERNFYGSTGEDHKKKDEFKKRIFEIFLDENKISLIVSACRENGLVGYLGLLEKVLEERKQSELFKIIKNNCDARKPLMPSASPSPTL